VAEAVEQALELGRGVMHIGYVDADKDESNWKVEKYSQHLACERCNLSFEPLNPHHYSFNSPLGWCPTCEGLGVQHGANANLLVRDTALSLRAGALAGWPALTAGSPWLPFAEAIAAHAGFDLDTPYEQLEPAHHRAILHGTGETWLPISRDAKSSERSAKRVRTFRSEDSASRLIKFQYKGLFPAVDEASRVSFVYRQRLEHLVDEVPCSACGGSRLRADSAATRFTGLTLGNLCDKPLGDTLALFRKLDLWPGPARRCPAAKPSEFASPRRSAAASPASCTCSMNRPLACTRATTNACLPP
jgi:excinuclease ABC subunit A